MHLYTICRYLRLLQEDPALRQKMGATGRKTVSNRTIEVSLLHIYMSMLCMCLYMHIPCFYFFDKPRFMTFHSICSVLKTVVADLLDWYFLGITKNEARLHMLKIGYICLLLFVTVPFAVISIQVYLAVVSIYVFSYIRVCNLSHFV